MKDSHFIDTAFHISSSDPRWLQIEGQTVRQVIKAYFALITCTPVRELILDFINSIPSVIPSISYKVTIKETQKVQLCSSLPTCTKCAAIEKYFDPKTYIDLPLELVINLIHEYIPNRLFFESNIVGICDKSNQCSESTS